MSQQIVDSEEPVSEVDNELANLLENLNLFFTESNGFTIFSSGKYISIKKSKKECLLLLFEKKEGKNFIIVNSLYKCNQENNIGSGKYNMTQLKSLADLNSNYVIEVEDDYSQVLVKVNDIQYRLNLKMMFIMTTGETWYNSLGFHEKNYHENTLLLQEFIENNISKIWDYLHSYDYDNEKNERRNLFITELIEKYPTNTIQEVFIKLFSFVKDMSKCEIDNLYDKLSILFLIGFKEDIQKIIDRKSSSLFYPEQPNRSSGGKITRKYLPKVSRRKYTRRKYRKIQSKQLLKSRKLYKKRIYYSIHKNNKEKKPRKN